MGLNKPFNWGPKYCQHNGNEEGNGNGEREGGNAAVQVNTLERLAQSSDQTD